MSNSNERERMKYLIERYFNKECTMDELAEFLKMVKDEKKDKELFAELGLQWNKDDSLPDVDEKYQDTQFSQIMLLAKTREKGLVRVLRIRRNMVRIGIAVAILVFFVGLVTIYRSSKQINGNKESQLLAGDLQPGGNKATLILDNGTSISLDSTLVGEIARQGNMQLVNKAGDRLEYLPYHVNSEGNVLFNTISTPRGGQYQITLPDGTRVWLNAASILRYPTSFNGPTRTVELTGEAYFEVHKNPQQPFHVTVSNLYQKDSMIIEVLGTHFNVNAYKEDGVFATTLLEGSVKIISKDGNTVLKPGQQSRVLSSGEVITSNVDTTGVIAWKNGMFYFKNESLDLIMNQMSRWYNIDVRYDVQIKEKFHATISRNETGSKLLHLLALTGDVHFEFADNKVIVKK